MANNHLQALAQACLKPIQAMRAFVNAPKMLNQLGYRHRDGRWAPMFDKLSYAQRLEGENKALLQLASQANVRAGQAEASFRQLSGEHLRLTNELNDAKRVMWLLVRQANEHRVAISLSDVAKMDDSFVLEARYGPGHHTRTYEALTADELTARWDAEDGRYGLGDWS